MEKYKVFDEGVVKVTENLLEEEIKKTLEIQERQAEAESKMFQLEAEKILNELLSNNTTVLPKGWSLKSQVIGDTEMFTIENSNGFCMVHRKRYNS